MRLFPDNAPRGQVLWLFGHAWPLMLVGVAQTAAAWDWIFDPRWHLRADYVLAGVGGIVAGAAGVALAVLCARRMRSPFAAREMRFGMTVILTAEVAILFLCSFILDLGGTQSMVFRFSLATNLALIMLATPPAGAYPIPSSSLDNPSP